MKTKRTNIIALLFAACLLFSTQAFAKDFPAYLTMDGTKITGCNRSALPANLVIPDGVTEIGESAFYGCESLVTVSIPATMTTIGRYAFKGCDNIKTVQYRGILAQWCQMDNDIWLVKNAKTITMSDLVDLKAMTALAIPNGVTKIGRGTFYGCESLTTVSIPDGVTKIGRSAFYGCTSLASVSIPASMTEIGSSAFKGCNNIKTVQYRGTLAQWWQIDNDYNLVGNAETITMPDGVDLKAMTTLAIPDGMTKIGSGAFAGCTSLATVSIPATVKKIGSSAFKGCDDIETVQYRGTFAQWCQIDNDASLVGNAETIMMSDGVDLKAMTAFTIPDGVIRIGDYAFAGCTSLASMSIPASVTEISGNAFKGCDDIETVQYRGTLAQWCQIDNGAYLADNAETIMMSDGVDLKAINALTIPDGVTRIGGCAFRSCTSLVSVSIPEGVTEIGINAFYGCTSLATVSIPASVKKIGSLAFDRTDFYCLNKSASVKKIRGSAFEEKNLKTVQYRGTLAQWLQIDDDYSNLENAKTITMSDVVDLKAMTALAISEGVTKIRKMAFYDCSSLASISIPASVTEIGINAFSGCRSLATVSIPAGVTEIGSGAFNLCSSLATVSIPASVKKIDWSAFSGCKSLAKITFSGTKEQWRNISKDYYWHTNVPAKKVVCTDGEADLD